MSESVRGPFELSRPRAVCPNISGVGGRIIAPEEKISRRVLGAGDIHRWKTVRAFAVLAQEWRGARRSPRAARVSQKFFWRSVRGQKQFEQGEDGDEQDDREHEQVRPAQDVAAASPALQAESFEGPGAVRASRHVDLRGEGAGREFENATSRAFNQGVVRPRSAPRGPHDAARAGRRAIVFPAQTF